MIAKTGCEIGSIDYSKENRVPLSDEKLEQLRTRLTQIMVDKLPELNESLGKIAEARKMQAEGRAMKAEGQAMQAEARAMRAQAETNLKEIAVKKQQILTRGFYAIFNGKNRLPAEQIDTVFNTYLTDRSVSIEKTAEGKSYPKISSMKAVIQYPTDHPSVSVCDFRPFKTEVHDVPTLAEFLKKSTVKAVAFNNGISQAAKESLAEAVAARKGGLRVQYFA